MEVGDIDGGGEKEKQLRKQEAQRGRELARQGVMIRLWRVPGRRENWGIWNAEDATQLHEWLASLPLYPYLRITVHPLATHPNDPAGYVNAKGS